ncbi:MAG: hypothetical protein AB9872_05460 [Solidesulfovibrio sp.]
MTGALSGNFAVLPANGPDDALRQVERHGPCRIAYIEVGDDPEASLRWTRELRKRDIVVIALVRKPNVKAVGDALASGRIQGTCLLPLSPESFLEQTRDTLNRLFPQNDNSSSQSKVLTRAEVDFLLDAPLSRQDN